MRKVLIAVLVIATMKASWAQQYYEQVVDRINHGQEIKVEPDPGQESVIPMCQESLRQWQSRSPQVRKIAMRSDKAKHVNVLVVSTAGDHLNLQFEDKRLVRAGFTLADHVRQMNVDEMPLRNAMKSWLAWYVSKDGHGRILQSYYSATVASSSSLGVDGPSGRPENEVAPKNVQATLYDEVQSLKEISTGLIGVPLEGSQYQNVVQANSCLVGNQKQLRVLVSQPGGARLDLYLLTNDKLVKSQRGGLLSRPAAEYLLWAEPAAARPDLLSYEQVQRAKRYLEQVLASKQCQLLWPAIKAADQNGQLRIGLTVGSDQIEVLWLDLKNYGEDGLCSSIAGISFTNGRIGQVFYEEHHGLFEENDRTASVRKNKYIDQFAARVCTIDPRRQPNKVEGGSGLALADLDNNKTRQVITRFFRLLALNNQQEVFSYFSSGALAGANQWWSRLGSVESLALEQVLLESDRQTITAYFPSSKGRQQIKFSFDGKKLEVVGF